MDVKLVVGRLGRRATRALGGAPDQREPAAPADLMCTAAHQHPIDPRCRCALHN